MDAGKTQLEAFDITRKVISQMRSRGQMPPPHMFNEEDFEDTVGDVYAHDVLPMLSKYDPSRAALITFIYPAIVQHAAKRAWKLKKCGINTRDRVDILHLPTTDDVDDSDADAFGITDFASAGLNPEHVSGADVMAYPDAPEGFESPGSDEWEDTQLRENRIAHVRRLVDRLPAQTRDDIIAGFLADEPRGRGRPRKGHQVEHIVAELEKHFTFNELTKIFTRGINNTINAAAADDCAMLRRRQGADAASDCVIEVNGV